MAQTIEGRFKNRSASGLKFATIIAKFFALSARKFFGGNLGRSAVTCAVAQRNILAIFYAKFQPKFMRTPASACESWIATLRVDTGKPEILEIRGPIESVG